MAGSQVIGRSRSEIRTALGYAHPGQSLPGNPALDQRPPKRRTAVRSPAAAALRVGTSEREFWVVTAPVLDDSGAVRSTDCGERHRTSPPTAKRSGSCAFNRDVLEQHQRRRHRYR